MFENQVAKRVLEPESQELIARRKTGNEGINSVNGTIISMGLEMHSVQYTGSG
jgi:hypothetical protein